MSEFIFCILLSPCCHALVPDWKAVHFAPSRCRPLFQVLSHGSVPSIVSLLLQLQHDLLVLNAPRPLHESMAFHPPQVFFQHCLLFRSSRDDRNHNLQCFACLLGHLCFFLDDSAPSITLKSFYTQIWTTQLGSRQL